MMAAEIRVYVTTKHSKGNNHIAKPEDTAKTLCGKSVTGEGVEDAGVCGNCNRLADRRGMVKAPKPEASQEGMDLTRTREAWLIRAIEMFRPRFVEVGLPIPEKVHVSVGYGADGRATEGAEILGICYASWVSVDKVNHIYISPEIGDSAEALVVLIHELIHAADDCKSGHKGAFAEAATRLGLVTPLTSSVPNVELAAELMTMAAALGEYPHGALDRKVLRNKIDPKAPMPEGIDLEQLPELTPVSSAPKAQTNRHVLLKCIAPGCDCEGYQVRTTRKWLEIGLPSCPLGNEMQAL
ncbi:hypothetical protein [Nonomuraea sp. B19D2]|uniref:hypothetical protein n=1 Tax=Nonomuraea sp. B19D2 TaxID=3159561 RepID=UPI0032D9E6B6